MNHEIAAAAQKALHAMGERCQLWRKATGLVEALFRNLPTAPHDTRQVFCNKRLVVRGDR
jgi:hypothetical protein